MRATSKHIRTHAHTLAHTHTHTCTRTFACTHLYTHMHAFTQEGNDVVLVQEYAEGGDLYRLLHKNGGR